MKYIALFNPPGLIKTVSAPVSVAEIESLSISIPAGWQVALFVRKGHLCHCACRKLTILIDNLLLSA